MYLVTANGEARGPGNSGAQVEWTSGQKRWIEDEFIRFYQHHPDVFTVGDKVVDPVQMVSVKHVVSAQELLSGFIEIPMPKAPESFHVNAFDATGAPIYFTDLVTAEENPSLIRITTTGDINLADTDVVFITAWA